MSFDVKFDLKQAVLDVLVSPEGRAAVAEALRAQPQRMPHAFRFTIDVTPDPEHPKTWVATCHELGTVSAARTPHDALVAIAGAVRCVVSGILETRGTPGAGLEVLREIAAGYAAQRSAPVTTGDLPLESPHAFAPGDPAIWGSKCARCGMTVGAARHRTDSPVSYATDIADRVRATLACWSVEERAAALEILRSSETEHRSPAQLAGVVPHIGRGGR